MNNNIMKIVIINVKFESLFVLNEYFMMIKPKQLINKPKNSTTRKTSLTIKRNSSIQSNVSDQSCMSDRIVYKKNPVE